MAKSGKRPPARNAQETAMDSDSGSDESSGPGGTSAAGQSHGDRDMRDIPPQEGYSKANAGAPASSGEPPRPGSRTGAPLRWRTMVLRLADFTLFCGILLYLVTLLTAAAVCFRLAVALGVHVLADDEWWKAPLVLLLCALAVHLLGKTIRTVLALTTQREDPTPEATVGIRLLPEQHPGLYELARQTSAMVRAPCPDAIRVGPRAECYSVEQRRFGFRTKRWLTLVIGLPHLSVLRIDELRVIVAHELIHFQHDTTMAVFLYRMLNHWKLKRRDAAGKPWMWVWPLLWFDWFACELLLLFSTPLQRYRELLADIGSATAFGGRLVRRTLVKDWILTHRFDDFLQARWEELKQGVVEPERISSGGGTPVPPSNVYLDFAEDWQEVSDAGNAYLLRRLAETERGSVWDTHPTLGERITAIRMIRRAESPLSASDQCKARDVVPDFEHITRAVEEMLRHQAGGSGVSGSGVTTPSTTQIAPNSGESDSL